MKTSASKRVLYLIVILLVLLLGGAAFYFKDVISNGIKYGRWFTVDRYEELFDYCNWNKSENGLNVHCKGFLYSMEEKTGEGDFFVCYKAKIYSEKTKILEDLTVCDYSRNIVWKNPFGGLEKAIPISLNLLFERNSLKGYISKGFTFSLLSEDEIEKLFEVVGEKEINTKIGIGKKIAGIYDSYSSYKGLCCEVDMGLVSSNSVSGFLILGAQLKSVSILNDQINLDLLAHVDGSKKEYSLNLLSNAFTFVREDGSSEYITSKNFNLIPIEATYNIQVSYLTPFFELDREETLKKCHNDFTKLSNDDKSICDNIRDLRITDEGGSFNIDEYEKKVLQSSESTVRMENVFVNYIQLKNFDERKDI